MPTSTKSIQTFKILGGTCMVWHDPMASSCSILWKCKILRVFLLNSSNSYLWSKLAVAQFKHIDQMAIHNQDLSENLFKNHWEHWKNTLSKRVRAGCNTLALKADASSCKAEDRTKESLSVLNVFQILKQYRAEPATFERRENRWSVSGIFQMITREPTDAQLQQQPGYWSQALRRNSWQQPPSTEPSTDVTTTTARGTRAKHWTHHDKYPENWTRTGTDATTTTASSRTTHYDK